VGATPVADNEAQPMYHSNTSCLLAYWGELAAAGEVPARADFDPMAMRAMLDQVFMLGRAAPGEFRFRLAGAMVGQLHGRELRAHLVLPLWADDDRLQVKTAMESVLRRGEPIVITTEGHAGPFTTSLEILMAPLAGPDGSVDRIVGLYQPLTPIARLQERPIDQLSVARIVKAFDPSDEAAPRLRLAAISGRRVG
jgi:hypothetical protein